MPDKNCFAYTGRFPVFRDRIVSTVKIASDGSGMVSSAEVRCLWDTGASFSLLSKSVADCLGLEPSDDIIPARGPFGASRVLGCKYAYVFLVLGAIPVRVRVAIDERPCSEDDCPLVLGLDFITKGDFALTHDGQQLMFSFCYPPVMPLDFTDILPRLGLDPATSVCEASDNLRPGTAAADWMDALRPPSR